MADVTRSRSATRMVLWLLALLGALLAVVLPAASSQAATFPAGSSPAGALTTATPSGDDEPGELTVEIALYWGNGCPKCAAERAWLKDVATEYSIDLTEYEVKDDAGNRELFAKAGDELGFEASAWPTTIIGERVWIGYTDSISEDIRGAIQLASVGEPVPAGVYGQAGSGTCDADELTCSADDTGANIDVPFIGNVKLDDHSLLLSTVIIGFVDGVNPCSLWVISVLLTIVVRSASRRRVVAIGSTFLLVTAAMYALYIVGIYSALSVVGFLGVIQWVVAVVAGIFGAVSIKDYFAFKKGLSFTISDSAKPGIYKRVREAAGHHKLLPALAATVALGVAVSLLETPCTAGFPVLWTGLLKANGVSFFGGSLLFVAYMIPFLLDEMAVFAIAIVTMRATKLQESQGELLKLFAGVTMVALAAVMALNPEFMESPVKATVLFAVAFVFTWVVHRVTVRVRKRRAADAVAEDVAEA